MKRKFKIKSIFYGFIVLLALTLIVLFFIFGRTHKNLPVKSENIIQELKISAEKKKINLSNIFINRDNDLITYTENVQIIFSIEKNIEKQTQALQKILKRTKIKKTIDIIDFRFNKIVVR